MTRSEARGVRDKNEVPTQRFFLKGLKPGTKYVLSDLDGTALPVMSGRGLMETGLTVALHAKPVAAVILYLEAKRP
jgi:hypothetical protein